MIRWKYPEMELNINMNVGDTLELDIKKKWGIDGFDVVVGNPPYNKPKESKVRKGGYGGNSLWDKFIEKTLNHFLKLEGLMLFVNPPAWRKPEHYLFNKMTKENQLVYLKCFSEQESKKMFRCSTIVDYYIIEKQTKYKKSIIYGQDNKEYNIDLEKWNFIPSGDIEIINKIIGSNEVVYNRSLYGTDKKWVSNNKDKEFKYKIIHNMTNNGYGYVWSSENKGHIGIKKVILSFGRHQYPYNDYLGELGMSQICFGIQIKTQEEGEKICKAINSKEFKSILKNTKWSTFQTEWRMFKYIKKDFWKEFE
jgi:hypothetical protein